MKKIFILFISFISAIVIAQSTTSDLILSLPFNGNANDISGNENNGTVYGPVLTSDRFGNTNSAYYFDGIDDYILINNSASLQSPSNHLTISAWAYTTGASFRHYIVDKRINVSTYPFTSYVLCSSKETDKTWQFTVSPAPIVDEKTLVVNSGSILEDSTWYHIVGVYDSSVMKIYINGALENTIPISGPIEYSDLPLYIGTAARVNEHFMNGIIDDIRIYNRSLDSIEINKLYTSSCFEIYYDTIPIYDTNYITVVDTNFVTIYDSISVTDTLFINIPITISDLILEMPFNGNANDESGNYNDGIVYGPELTSDRFGNPNNAYYFDGINDYIEVPNSFSLQSPSTRVTISAWAYTTGYSFRHYIVDKRINVSFYPFTSYVLCSSRETDKTWQFTASPAPIVEGKTLVVNSGTILEDSIWYHIVGVYDSSIMKIYVNGVLEDTVSISGSIEYSDLPLYIGTAARVNEHFMNGIIDDIKIFNRALNSPEIEELYQDGITDNQIIHKYITVKVYPNPTSDKVNINFGEKYSLLSNYTLKIINTRGQQIFESKINQNLIEIDLRTFGSKGLYFIQIFDNINNIIEIKKLILR